MKKIAFVIILIFLNFQFSTVAAAYKKEKTSYTKYSTKKKISGKHQNKTLKNSGKKTDKKDIKQKQEVIRFQGEVPKEMLENRDLSMFRRYFSDLSREEKDKIINDFKGNYKDFEKFYLINKYEGLISGSIAIVLGTAGFYGIASENNLLEKLTYSMIQSFGIISFGVGSYNLMTPTIFEKYLNILENMKNTKDENIVFVASEIMKYYAEKARSQRITTSITTAVLTTAYLTSALTSLNNGTLAKIYFFLAGINMIISAGSYFMTTKYEKIYEDFKKSKIMKKYNFSYDYNVFPVIVKTENSAIMGAGFNLRF